MTLDFPVYVPVDFQARTRAGHVLTRVRGRYPLAGRSVRLIDRLEHLEADGRAVSHDLDSGLVTIEVAWDTLVSTERRDKRRG